MIASLNFKQNTEAIHQKKKKCAEQSTHDNRRQRLDTKDKMAAAA